MQITRDEIELHRPDVLLPPDTEFADAYAVDAAYGRNIAARRSVAFVAICRNAMPWLPMTLNLVEQTGAMFRDWSAFIYENDSSDDTKDALIQWADHDQRRVSLNVNGRPHLNHTTDQERTHALAEYRTACQWHVAHGTKPDYVVVFDTDPWGGWSIDGVATSIAWLDASDDLYGLASYSWAEATSGEHDARIPIHYDAFAARLNHWGRRDQQWFHLWHPAVGSPPVQFNSAFGQLAVYRTRAYLAGRYTGEDCEHVTLHRSIHRAGMGRIALNPSMRCVSFWVPNGR